MATSTNGGTTLDIMQLSKRQKKFFAMFLEKSPSNLVKDEAKLHLLEGNNYFKGGRWFEAVERYTICIKFGVPFAGTTTGKSLDIRKNVIAVAASNRAQALLNLRLWDKALLSAEEALQLDPDNVKALYRKAKALMALQEFLKASVTLERALELSPTNKAVKEELDSSNALLQQSRTGVFDLVGIICRGGYAPLMSDFVGPVEIKRSPGKGRGLFLTENVEAGRLLLVSNATALAGHIDPDASSRDMGPLKAEAVQTCLASKRTFHQVLTLFRKDEPSVGKVDYIPPMELFTPGSNWSPDSQITYEIPPQEELSTLQNLAFDAMATTCPVQFGGSRRSLNAADELSACQGLWILPSFINHSCVPNCNYRLYGKALILRASESMDAGQELSISYVSHHWFQRKDFQPSWNFTCMCERCKFDREFRPHLKDLYCKVDSLYETFLNGEKNDPFDVEMIHNMVSRIQDALEKLPMALTEKQMHWVRLSFDLVYGLYLNRGKRFLTRKEKLRLCQIMSAANRSTGMVGGDWSEDVAVATLYFTELEFGKDSREYKKARDDVRSQFALLLGNMDDSAVERLLKERCSMYDLSIDVDMGD